MKQSDLTYLLLFRWRHFISRLRWSQVFTTDWYV